MFIQVNQELCTGCGTCVDSCPVEAIQLVDQRAVIDDALCTQCDACIDACPNGAITVLPVPIPGRSIVSLTPIQTTPLEIAATANGKRPLAEAALSFLGHEVAPRLIDMLMTVVERKLVQSTATTPVVTSSQIHTTRGRNERRQIRYRGGRAGNPNHKERR